MNRALRMTFSLKSTYYVNSIIYSLKQIPLLGRILPDSFYSVQWFKGMGKILLLVWEIAMTFITKGAYFSFIIAGVLDMFTPADKGRTFLHIFVFLSIIGSFINSFLFNPTKDKYYAMILLRENSKIYALVNYGYEIFKVLVGFATFGILFGQKYNLSIWQCVLIPLFTVSLKFIAAAHFLEDYERDGVVTNENNLSRFKWIAMFVLLAVAYGVPALGTALPKAVSLILMIVCIVMGCFSVEKIISFRYYREMYREMFWETENQMDTANAVVAVQKEQSRKVISSDTRISSKSKGFEYLNDLFIKRHKQILWGSAMKLATFFGGVILVGILGLYWKPEWKVIVNELIINFLPLSVIIMYAINRGAGFTRVLFVNCDHSLLTYSFYKHPAFVLELYQIRLQEIVIINLLPAAVLGMGMALLLWISGGTGNPMNYVMVIVSLCGMSIFFSVHHLTIYYLLQPYNAETEIKSATYQIVNTATYMACFVVMNENVSMLRFGAMTILFCLLYCLVARILVYFFAAKTFRLRT